MNSMNEELDQSWLGRICELTGEVAAGAAEHDRDATFVRDQYERLRDAQVLGSLVPTELGGQGVCHATMAEGLRLIGRACSATGLALSMHQHLLAAMVWKYRQGQGGEAMLRRVATEQPVLVSTGARDWLDSNGTAERVSGGFRVSGMKRFASQSAAGDLLVSSVPFEDPDAGAQVLHFVTPFSSEGLELDDDWDTLGMRGTGSQGVRLDGVFVPDPAVTLRRPQGEFHPFWNVVLGVALPLIMGVYVGVAQQAAAIAVRTVQKQTAPKPFAPAAIGAMQNDLTVAEVLWRDMVRLANNLDFKPEDALGQEMLSRKTSVASACIRTVEQAMRIVGGQGFYRRFGLERLFRDIQAAHYHPLPEPDQTEALGQFLLEKSGG